MLDARMYCPLRMIGKKDNELEQAKCKRETCMWWGVFTSKEGTDASCSIPLLTSFLGHDFPLLKEAIEKLNR